jgi:hypothetical protein
MGVDPAAFGLLAAFDRLRDDFREDLAATEGRVMSAIEDTGKHFAAYREEHGREHIAQRGDSIAAHKRFDTFIAESAIEQARKAGALGVLRFTVDLLGRNWKILATIAAAVLAAAGHVQIVAGPL